MLLADELKPNNCNKKKMRIKSLISLIALLTYVGGAYCQISSPVLADKEGKYNYNYVPVSPSSEELMKHIMCPVNYNTGKADLSIPIYEIRTRDFTLPLRLQYDSGGIKVCAGNGVAGLGWNMDFGPTVTRSIQGNPDEEGYLIYNPDFGSDNASYLRKMTEGLAHEQPDIFFYSTFDAQGNFVFCRPETSSESGKYTPVYLPLTPDKIETENLRSGFRVTDGSGNIYRFTEPEYSNTSQLTGWKLTDVTSLNKDKLSFTYTIQRYSNVDSYDYYAIEDMGESTRTCYWQGVDGKVWHFQMNGYELQNDSLWANFLPEEAGQYDQHPNRTVEAKLPKEITYANGKVVFDYASSLLKTVHIYENGVEIQRVTLGYKQLRFIGRCLLTEVKFTELPGGQSRSYLLSYHDYINEYSPMQTKAMDRFGYYNGKTGNTDLVERQLAEFYLPYEEERGVCYAYIGGADRTPDISSAQAYSLQSIKYPTGAKEEFVYELNTCPMIDEYGNEIQGYAGGLRIRSIQCRDADGALKNERCFLYEEEGVPTGYAPQISFVDEMEKTYLYLFYRHSMRYRLYSSLPLADAGAAAGISVFYPNVSVVEKDAYGKTVAREDYRYNIDFCFPAIMNGMVHDDVSHYKKGELVCRTDYDVATGRPAHEEKYSYGNLSLKNNTPLVQGREVRRSNLVIEECPGLELEGDRYYREYRYLIGRGNIRPVNLATVKTDYYDGRTVSDTVVWSYGSTDWDARSGLPVEELYMYGNGMKRRSEYTYPYHVNNSVEKAMTQANDIQRPVCIGESIEYPECRKDNFFVHYYYELPSGSNQALLSGVRVDRHEGLFYMSESYPVHDACGNICEIHPMDAPVVALLWGYNYSHPVAVVEGASYEEVVAALDVSVESLQSLDGSALENVLLPLRTAFPSPCRVTLYQYAPQRGMVYKNEPNGNITTYTYDGFGRLTEIRDKDGAVVQYNEYEN